jgi:hypothetical protein
MRIQDIGRTITTRRSALLLGVVAFATLSSCRGGCRREASGDGVLTVQGRLAPFPATARVVVGIDVAQLRASPAAAKVQQLAADSGGDKNALVEFQRRTGFDPVKQLSNLTIAFPDDARGSGDFGLVLRADRFDEARLVAYARDELQKSGDDLVATKHGRLTLWSSKRDPSVVGFFPDDHTFALGAGTWGPRMADLVDTASGGDSAATNLELVRLVERAAGTHAIWGAAIVPAETRKTLAAQPGLADAASINTLSAAIDFGKGAEAMLIADVATADAARALATKVAESLRDAKRNPQVLMLGLGPYLGGVSARAVDRTFEVHATLGPDAVDDLVTRLGAMVALARAGSAPGFAPPAPKP